MVRVIITVLFLLAPLRAQLSNATVVLPGAPPGGVGAACTAPNLFYANLTTGVLASCVSSAWTAFGTGGSGGTVTSIDLVGTANQITITGSSPITTSGSWTVSIPSSPVFAGTITAPTLVGTAISTPAAPGTGLVKLYPKGAVWCAEDSTATETCMGGGGVTSITGTSLQITASAATGAVTLSIPSSPSFSGLISEPGVLSTGTKFTISGCSAGTTLGGATAGSFVSGTTGTCTVVITMNGATGLTATTGWACDAHDLTTPSDIFGQTAYTTTTATLTATTVSGDLVAFKCVGF